MFEFSNNPMSIYKVHWQVIDPQGDVFHGTECVTDISVEKAESSVELWLRSMWPERRAMWVRAVDALTL